MLFLRESRYSRQPFSTRRMFRDKVEHISNGRRHYGLQEKLERIKQMRKTGNEGLSVEWKIEIIYLPTCLSAFGGMTRRRLEKWSVRYTDLVLYSESFFLFAKSWKREKLWNFGRSKVVFGCHQAVVIPDPFNMLLKSLCYNNKASRFLCVLNCASFIFIASALSGRAERTFDKSGK